MLIDDGGLEGFVVENTGMRCSTNLRSEAW